MFLCARFQSDPRETHLTTVKRIFRYLKGTTNLGLLYKKSLDYKLVGFCDADYVQKGVLDIQFLDTDHQWADIFTKPLTVDRFNFIKKNLNMHFVSE